MDFQHTILFEDQDIVVLSKPPGVVVNESDTSAGGTIQGWFAEYLAQTPFPADWESLVPDGFQAEYGTPQEIFTQRQGIVHRLDKDTSGVLVLAKHPGSLVALLRAFRVRSVLKTYLCLVHGKLQTEQDTISLPLGRSPRNRQQFAVVVSGRPAVTEYEVAQFFSRFRRETLDLHWAELKYRAPQGYRKKLSSYQSFSLVRCHPITGRTHQIRVHFAHIHHPIVGDATYVGKKRAKLDAVWCPRQFLHAATLTIRHPRTNQEHTFEAALPEDLAQALMFVGE